jgi:hypothetical protein
MAAKYPSAGGVEWSAIMKKGKRKNPHAVALGRLGGLVRSEAKRRANRKNGRKGGLSKAARKKWPHDAMHDVRVPVAARNHRARNCFSAGSVRRRSHWLG